MISIIEIHESEISLKGDLSHLEMLRVKKQFEEKILHRSHSTLEVDLSEVTSVSSIVLSLLLFGLRAAESASCMLKYKNMPQNLFNMARVGGVEHILTVSDL